MNIDIHEDHGKWYIRLQNRWRWSSPGDYWTDLEVESKTFESEEGARAFLEEYRALIEAAS
jgi:hypothetical protein